MDWKLRVADEEGPDVSRSTAGRGRGEAIWLPTTMLPRCGVRWTTHDDTHISAHYELAGVPIEVRLSLGPDGSIRLRFSTGGVTRTRPATGAGIGSAGVITAQRTFAGLTIPSRGQLGWHFGTDRWPEGEFFRFTITGLRPVPTAGAHG